MMEWVKTKNRLPTLEDSRRVLTFNGDTKWTDQVLATTSGGEVRFVMFSYVRKGEHTAWCQIPDAYIPKKVWRMPTLDDLKNGPILCRWGTLGICFKGGCDCWKDGMLYAIDVRPGNANRYFTDGGWRSGCEIEVDDE